MTSWHHSAWQFPRCRAMACQAHFAHLTSEISAPWWSLCWELSKQHWNLLPWRSMVSNQHSPNCREKDGSLRSCAMTDFECRLFLWLRSRVYTDCTKCPVQMKAKCSGRLHAVLSSSPALCRNSECFWYVIMTAGFYWKGHIKALKVHFPSHTTPAYLCQGCHLVLWISYIFICFLLGNVKSDWRAI